MALSEEQRRRAIYLISQPWVDEVSEDSQVDRFSEVLAQVENPEELHLYALEHNWDSGVEYLRRMVEHPLCDAGTALLIFWLGDSNGLYADALEGDGRGLGEEDEEVYRLQKAIEFKYLNGLFASRRIRVDPRSLPEDWVGEPSERGSGLIPDEMKRPSPGHAFSEIEDQWHG